MAGLLDYIVNSMSGGQRSPEEIQASLYAKRAASAAGDLNATRGEATPQDLMRVMANMKNSAPQQGDVEALRALEAQRKLATSMPSNVPNLQTLQMESLKNSLPYSLYRPTGAYQSPQNTMQNVLPELGGMSARNTQPMDMNALLRLLGR